MKNFAISLTEYIILSGKQNSQCTGSKDKCDDFCGKNGCDTSEAKISLRTLCNYAIVIAEEKTTICKK